MSKLLRRAHREPPLSLLKLMVGGWATSVQVAALDQYPIGEQASSYPCAGSPSGGTKKMLERIAETMIPFQLQRFGTQPRGTRGNSWGPD